MTRKINRVVSRALTLSALTLSALTLATLAISGALSAGQANAGQTSAAQNSVNNSGGPLLPQQAAYDVQFYDLNLAVDPETQSIAGVLTVKADVVAPLQQFVLDLDGRLTASKITSGGSRGASTLTFDQRDGRLWIDLGRQYQPGEQLEVAVSYAGTPRVAPRPPWDGGFTWEKTRDGEHWIGVSCFSEGPDMWWPAKDHPSDEPDQGVALHFTVPDDLTVISNGKFIGREDNGNGTATFNWRMNATINLYNVTFNAGPFVAVTHDYQSISGRPLPITFWALPEDLDAARAQMPELADHLKFYEEVLGPYPFQGDKYALVEAPYIAMEHSTNITHGKAAMKIIRMGFHYVPLHELGHEWWGNLVSNDDFAHVWLQEGFDSYMEALYAERTSGAAGYLEYIARFSRPGVKDNAAVVPRQPGTSRDVMDTHDPYLKGGMVLHSLRFVVGDEAMFKILRLQAYPKGDPSSRPEELLSCGQCRNTNSAEFAALAEKVSGMDLDWFFELYLYRPELPQLITEDRGDSLALHWQVPAGVDFPMPVEISRNGKRERIAMPGGQAVIKKQTGDVIEADPDFRVLRHAKPDPDRFGTLGKGDATGLQSQNEGD